MKKNPQYKEFIKWLIQMIILALVLFISVQLVFKFILSKDVVSGISMEQTFNNGDRLLTYRLGDIKRGDIVVLNAPDQPGTLYIKRVIGLPGDRVRSKNDVLYVNGKRIAEKYLTKYNNNGNYFTRNFTLQSRLGVSKVPKGHYFVLGDNRPVSKDSRYIGFIKKKAIIGKVKFRYWPLYKLHFY